MVIILGFDREEFDKFLIDENCIEFGEFTLKSGRTSYYYVNSRDLLKSKRCVEEMVEYAYSFAEENVISENCKPASFYGIPEGATPWGLLLTQRIEYLPSDGAHPLMGRGSSKDHGDPKDRNFLGDTEGEVVVVDDVATTGSSIIEGLDRLEEAGFDVSNVFVFLDRFESPNDKAVSEKIEERGYNYHWMTRPDTLLKIGLEEKELEEEVREGIRDYLKEYSELDLEIV